VALEAQGVSPDDLRGIGRGFLGYLAQGRGRIAALARAALAMLDILDGPEPPAASPAPDTEP
jgi:hypothetical protein